MRLPPPVPPVAIPPTANREARGPGFHGHHPDHVKRPTYFLWTHPAWFG